MAKPSELAAYLFDGKRSKLSGDALRWMEASPRFLAFAETYRDKIRKKIRVTRAAENALDLRAELEVAYFLLSNQRFTVQYEPYASARGRGPDFAVTYRANLTFNIEVARIRGDANGLDLARKAERILRVLLDKLGQMQPGMPNLLAIQAPSELAAALDLERMLQEIKLLAERKDPAFYALSRYASPAAFYKDFLRLSGILLWSAASAEPPPPAAPQLWPNKQARPELDEKIQRQVAQAAQAMFAEQ